MRRAGVVSVLAVLVLAACSGDRLTQVRSVPPPTHVPTADLALLLDHAGNPADHLTVSGINDSGVVVGTLADGGPPQATIWTPPGLAPTALPLPTDAVTSVGTRIANDGTVLGQVCDAASHCTWVTWQGGTISPVNPQGDARDICPCDGQVIVGGLTVHGVMHAVIWTHGKLLDLGVPPGFASAEFVAVDEGFMAATAVRLDGTKAPFRWSPQFGFQALPVAGGDVSAVDVNALGTVLADDDHIYPLTGGSVAFPAMLSHGTAINDSDWVSGVFQQAAPPGGEAPPPTSGAARIGTDSLAQLSGDNNSVTFDIDNAGDVLGMNTRLPQGWVDNIHSHFP